MLNPSREKKAVELQACLKSVKMTSEVCLSSEVKLLQMSKLKIMKNSHYFILVTSMCPQILDTAIRF